MNLQEMSEYSSSISMKLAKLIGRQIVRAIFMIFSGVRIAGVFELIDDQ